MAQLAGDILDSLLSLDPREASTQAHEVVGRSQTLRCPCGGSTEVRVPPPPDEGGLCELLDEPCAACATPLTFDPNLGRLLASRWRLERRLGGGGMGNVYLAVDERLGRQVAVKVLHRDLGAAAEHRERFDREARVMARLEHPNLATLHAAELDKQVPFLVMKVVRGHTLARLVMKRPSGWALCDVLPIVKQVGAGLSELHRCGFVHRDLKPGNIMVTAQGHVTLLDYGLTRTVESTLTKPGVVLGSPQFMSPEQVTAHPLDARSDQYSLALLCSLLLTGKLPYETCSTLTMLVQHVEHAPEPAHLSNPLVPREASEVLLKAMRKRPQDRYQSIDAFLGAFERACRSTVHAHPSIDELPTNKLRAVQPSSRLSHLPPAAERTPASAPRLTDASLVIALSPTLIRAGDPGATARELPSPVTTAVDTGVSVIVEKSLMAFMPTLSDAPMVPPRATPKSPHRAGPPSKWIPSELRWDVAVLSALMACIVVALLVLIV
jgi:serine/threonine-protein kinase